MQNILIRGGTLFDGSGSPGVPGDILIVDGRIAVIGQNLAGRARKTIDADGLAVMHTKSPTEVLESAIAWSRSAGLGELPELRVHRPTLEDVYLDLIRRSESEPHDV